MSMIVLYLGRRGSGKTLTMNKDIITYASKGVPIIANYTLKGVPYKKISDEEVLAIDKHSDIRDCVLAIDELQILIDSRRSASNKNMNFSNFIQQIRKRNIILLGTTQDIGTVDLRLRTHADIEVFPRFDKDTLVVEAVYIDRTSLQEQYFGIGEQAEVDKVYCYYYAKPLFELYDTAEMIT